MRVRMFKREAFAPGAGASGRWVPHGVYSATLLNCINWLPRQDGGKQTEVGQEYLLVEQNSELTVTQVATVRIAESPRELVAVMI